MKKTAIFYGSTMGNTKAVAEQLAKKLNADIFDVAKTPNDKLSEYSNLIFGTSTWGVGDLQDDWEEFISYLENADISNLVVAIFGFGDSSTYSDTFVDGIGTIYNIVKDKGCKIVGHTAVESYEYDASTAEVDGKFVGLPLDDENQSQLTNERVDAWVEQIKVDFI